MMESFTVQSTCRDPRCSQSRRAGVLSLRLVLDTAVLSLQKGSPPISFGGVFAGDRKPGAVRSRNRLRAQWQTIHLSSDAAFNDVLIRESASFSL